MIDYTWSFTAFEAYPQHEGEAKVVFTVHWRLDGTDGEHSAGVYGTAALNPFEAGMPFIPFDQLTPAQVQAWVEEVMGSEQVQSLKDGIDAQIEQQANPTSLTLSPPWSAA